MDLVTHIKCLKCGWTGHTSRIGFCLANAKVFHLGSVIHDQEVLMAAGQCPECGDFYFEDATPQ